MLETDLLLDRGRLKRRIAFWRVFAVLAVVFALLVTVGSHRAGNPIGLPRVALLNVDGLITDNDDLAGSVRKLADDASVRALIVSIDSPGGSVAGGESLHDAIAAVAARKPVVAVMRGEAASAGYMIAAPAARIFARQSTITGSIGVLMQTGEVSGLLSRIGVGATQIVSGPLKGQPDITQPLQPAARAYLQGIVDDLFDQFIAIVADGRHMDPVRVRALADGRAYTGRQALPLGLVDQFGGEAEARQWLADNRHVGLGLPLSDIRHQTWMQRHFDAQGALGGSFGAVGRLLFGAPSTLDGPLALWLPSS